MMPKQILYTLITAVLIGLGVSPAQAACLKLEWSCFDSSVALVGRAQDGSIKSFCSGVAVSKREIFTAGHCVKSLSKSSVVKIQVYREPRVPYAQDPAAEGIPATLQLNADYDRSTSLFFHDRGTFELDRDLPEDLNYPLIASRTSPALATEVASLLKVGTQLERIGFGQRPIVIDGVESNDFENRRTWNKPVIDSMLSDVLITNDPSPRPGDSGGPVYLFIPGTGLVLVALHSTWDPSTRRVLSPRVF